MFSAKRANGSGSREPPSVRQLCAGSSLAVADLVLRLGVEVARLVTLVQLGRGVARETIDHAPALHGRTPGDGVGPAVHILVVMHRQEFTRAIEQAFRQAAIPGPDRNIGDRILAA